MTTPIEDGFPGLQEQPEPITVQLHLLVDISTSMIGRWAQTISGLNEYIDSLRLIKTVNYKVTITEFGLENEVRDLYTEVDLDNVAKFIHTTFYPHGSGTALWAAVGITLKKINTTDPVLFVVVTDGEDNSSHIYGSEEVNKMIDERSKLGNYTYAYLGVAKEAWGQEAKIPAFAASHSNVAGADYNIGTYTGLAAATATYSATMSRNAALRSSGHRGVAMSMSSLFTQPEPFPVGGDTPVVTNSAGAPPAPSPAPWTAGEDDGQ